MNIDCTSPVQQLYKDIVKLLVSKHQTLDILGAIIQQKSKLQSLLPSWVPEWSFSTIRVDERSFARKLVMMDPEHSVSKV
jgi:hypothetical protein